MTIRNGTVSYDGGRISRGGGINASASKNVSINLIFSNDSITGNYAETAGAGINVSGTGSQITLCLRETQISGNNSDHLAGGVNISSYGGSMDVVLQNNIITNNTANNYGAGVVIMGGDNASLNVKISENTVRGNNVTRLLPNGDGGMDGGGFAISGSGSGTRVAVAMTNNIINGNEAPFGGGIFEDSNGNAEVDISLAHNLIHKNTANKSGGGIYSISGSTQADEGLGGTVNWQLTNNTICYNKTQRDSSGIGSSTAAGGSTIISSRNDIIWGNTGPAEEDPQVNLINMWDNAVAFTFKASYSDIPTIFVPKGTNLDADNVLKADPMFIDAASGNFELQNSSPCIDAGDPGADYRDGLRPPAKGTDRNDMGAYGGPQNNTWPIEIDKTVADLVSRHIVASASDYRLNDTLTRGEFSKLVALARGQTDQTLSDFFSQLDTSQIPPDVKGQWFAPYAMYCISKGFMSCNGGLFSSQGNVTSEQLLTIMIRLIGKGAELTAKQASGMDWVNAAFSVGQQYQIAYNLEQGQAVTRAQAFAVLEKTLQLM